LDRVSRAAAIADATRAFEAAVPNLLELLQIVAERVAITTGDYCSVALVSSDGQRFEPLVAFHTNPMLVEESRQFLGMSMDIEATGPWKQVLRDRETAVLQIDPDHPSEGMAPHQLLHIQRWRIREAALIPLVAGGSVVGGLNVNRLEGVARFTANDIQLLERLGKHAADAIAKARVLQDSDPAAFGSDANTRQ
jgi:GAF domain-containing protein